MPSVTYLDTDGERWSFGNRERSADAVIFYDASANRLVIAAPGCVNCVAGGIGFDVGTTRVMALTSGGGLIFNECSADVDFRWESNGETHMLFIDGGNDQVMVGGAAGGDTTHRFFAVSDVAGVSGAPFGVYWKSGSPAACDEIVQGWFADEAGSNTTQEYGRLTLKMLDVACGAEDAHWALDTMVGGTLVNDLLKIGVLTADAQAEAVFNDDGDDFDFRVESDCNPNLIASCGALDSMGLGSAPVTGAFLAIIGSAQTRNVVTGVGTMVHYPADIHTCGLGSASIAEVADVFMGIKTYNGGAAMTYTQLSTLHLDGPPVANTCVTGTTIATLLIKAGSLQLGLVGGVAPTLDFQGSSACVTKFAAGTDPMNITYTLPADASISTGEQLASTCAGVLSWATASSLRERKDIAGISCKDLAYENIMGALVYDYRYKEEWFHKTLGSTKPDPFTGVVAEEAPWAMQGTHNCQFSGINAFGQLTLAFQVLAEKVQLLEAEA